MSANNSPADALSDNWAEHVSRKYPGLSPADIDGLRCAYLNGGAFAMLGILIAAPMGSDA